MTTISSPNALFSVIVHKATRRPFVVEGGLSLRAAEEAAAKLYETSKIFCKHESLATGVSVLVLEDTLAQGTLNGYVLAANSVYQCGCY